jgi:hypothetical protein
MKASPTTELPIDRRALTQAMEVPMAKANGDYHKRDLTFADDVPSRMKATAIVLARFYAKKAVKAQLKGWGTRLS